MLNFMKDGLLSVSLAVHIFTKRVSFECIVCGGDSTAITSVSSILRWGGAVKVKALRN